VAKFIPNAIMLYREDGMVTIDGKKVEGRIFDRDSPTFEEDSAGWKTHAEMWPSDGTEIFVSPPRRGRPPKLETIDRGE
jgi:hypothetical protein